MLNAILQLSQCYTGVGWGDMPSNFVGENMPMSPNNSGEGDIHQYFRIYMVRPWLCGLPLIFVNSVFFSEYPQYIVHDSICWLLHLLFFVTFFFFAVQEISQKSPPPTMRRNCCSCTFPILLSLSTLKSSPFTVLFLPSILPPVSLFYPVSYLPPFISFPSLFNTLYLYPQPLLALPHLTFNLPHL